MSEQISIPDWIVSKVGLLTLENESLRQALADAQRALAALQPEPSNGQVPVEELVP